MPSAIVIAQSIAKVLAPMCFQNETPISEHVFEHVLDQHVFKMLWNLIMHSETCSKNRSLVLKTHGASNRSLFHTLLLSLVDINITQSFFIET